MEQISEVMMKKIFKTISLSTFLPLIALATWGYFLLSTKVAFAVDVGVKVGGKSSFAGFNAYVNAVLKYSLQLGGALGTLMLIYAGIKYLTSQGNQTQISDAKEVALGAIIGVVMLFLVNAILRFLGVI